MEEEYRHQIPFLCQQRKTEVGEEVDEEELIITHRKPEDDVWALHEPEEW